MSDKKNPNRLDKTELHALLSATPNTTHTKLDVLKKALNSNTYTINSKRIAEAILDASETEKVSTEAKETVAQAETV